MKAVNSNTTEHFINTSFGNLGLFRGLYTVQNFRPHFHECYTIIFVDKGVGDYSTSKSNFIMAKDTVLILNPYEVHTGKSVNNKPWSFLTLYIPVDIMKKADAQNENALLTPFFKENKIHDKELFKMGLAIFPYLVEQSDFEATESALMGFLQNLLNKYSHDFVEETDLSKRFIIAKKIHDYIHESYDDEVSLSLLSEELHINTYNLIKIFKEYYDLPPHQYLVNLKIEKAKILLLENKSCTEVAYLSGFFDQSHFIRHFKKIVGITPKRYAAVTTGEK